MWNTIKWCLHEILIRLEEYTSWVTGLKTIIINQKVTLLFPPLHKVDPKHALISDLKQYCQPTLYFLHWSDYIFTQSLIYPSEWVENTHKVAPKKKNMKYISPYWMVGELNITTSFNKRKQLKNMHSLPIQQHNRLRNPTRV